MKGAQRTVVILLLNIIITRVLGLQCYQCTTMTTRSCFTYNLKKEHLRECENRTVRPVCRIITQVQFFTPEQEITIIRECAYQYNELGCVRSKFSDVHYSLACECDQDGCNRARGGYVTWIVLLVLCHLVL